MVVIYNNVSSALDVVFTSQLYRNMKYCSVQKYADVTEVYLSFIPDKVVENIQDDLERLNTASLKHLLVLNPSNILLRYLAKTITRVA